MSCNLLGVVAFYSLLNDICSDPVQFLESLREYSEGFPLLVLNHHFKRSEARDAAW